jgi:hypothetical protein
MSPHPKSLEPAKCLWCGLVGRVPHRSDTDCISALREAVKLHKSALEVSGAAANLAMPVAQTGAAGLSKRSPASVDHAGPPRRDHP